MSTAMPSLFSCVLLAVLGIGSHVALAELPSPEIAVSTFDQTELVSHGPLPDDVLAFNGTVQTQCAPGLARPVVLTVKNLGSSDLTGLRSTLSGDGASQFSVSHPLPAVIPPGGQASLVVMFAPIASLSARCHLSITSNDADESPFGITLIGDSHVAGPLLAVREVGTGDKLPLTEATARGTSTRAEYTISGQQPLVLTNYGTADIDGLSISSPSIASPLPSGTRLAAGASMSVKLSFHLLIAGEIVTVLGNNGQVRFGLWLKPNGIITWGPITTGPGNIVISPGPIIVGPPLNSGNLVLSGPGSGPIGMALQWPLGELDSGAVAGSAIIATKVTGFASGGSLNITASTTKTGSPTYISTDTSAAATKVKSTLGAHFDGASKVTSSLTISRLDNFALEAWLRPMTSTGTQVALYQGTAGTNGQGFVQVDDTIRARFGGVGDVGQATFTAGEWVHVALVRKAGVSTLYLNGIAAGSSTIVPNAPSGGAMTFGATPAGSDYFTGDVDEVRVSFIGEGFDPSVHLLYAESGPHLYVSTVTNNTSTEVTTSLDCGSAKTSHATSKPLRLSNTSMFTLSGITASIDGANASDFKLGNAVPSSLGAYGAQSLNVNFTPSTAGPRTATLHLTSSDPAHASMDIALSGTGLPEPEIVVEDGEGHELQSGGRTLTFSLEHPTQTITVRNTGAGELGALQFFANDPGFSVSPALPASLAPGASATATITCTSTSYAALTTNAQINSDDADESSFVIPLQFTGSPKMRIAVGSVAPLEDHREVLNFTRLREQVLEFSNTSVVPLHVAFESTGPNKDDFSIGANRIIVAPGESRRVGVTFYPRGDGIRSTLLRLRSDDPQQGTMEIALMGRADVARLASQVIGQGGLDYGSALRFPPTVVGKTSSFTVEITNTTNESINDIVIETTPAPDFTFNFRQHQAIAAGGKALLTIAFKPSAAGQRGPTTVRLRRGSAADQFFAVSGFGVTKPTAEVSTLGLLSLIGGPSIRLSAPPITDYPVFKNLIEDLPVAYQWRKNGTPIRGATSSEYLLDVQSFDDAGTYSVTITNPAGSSTFDCALIGVVDSEIAGAPRVAATGKPFTLKARTAGKGLSFQWYDEGNPLLGLTSATASITPTTDGTHYYWCNVSIGDNSLPIGTAVVESVSTGPSCLWPNTEPWVLYVGGFYDRFLQAKPQPTGFSMTNEPPGLKIDPVTGELSGVPTAPGLFNVKFQASNPAGRGPVLTVPLLVKPLESNVLGTFAGLFERSPENPLGGRFTVTTTSTGGFSGRVWLGQSDFGFAGTLSGSDANGAAGWSNPVRLGPGDELTVLVDLNVKERGARLWVAHPGILISNYGSKRTAPGPLAGRYNAIIRTNDLQRGITTAIPDGNGYISMIVDASGGITTSGRMGDGAAFTSTSTFTVGAAPLFHLLYNGRGSALGDVEFVPNGATGQCFGRLSWTKQAIPGDRSYPEGWAPLNASIEGGKYARPAPGRRLLDLPEGSPNARFVFDRGILGKQSVTQPIAFSTTTYRLLKSEDGVRGFTWTVNADTGVFSGALQTQASSSSSAPQPVKISFFGLLVPSQAIGVGLFTDNVSNTSGVMRLVPLVRN